MKTIRMLLAAAFVAAAPTVAHAQSIDALLSIKRDLEAMCDGPDSPSVNHREMCALHWRMTFAILVSGWCNGKKGQQPSQFTWHRCTRNSLKDDMGIDRRAPIYVPGAGALNEYMFITEQLIERCGQGSPQCTARDKLIGALKKRGYCYGSNTSNVDPPWGGCER